MEIKRLPALSDNYIFLLHDANNNTAAVVDPAVAEPVLNCLDQLGAKLIAIFNTHHHADHVGGNKKLMEQFPDLCVYGSKEDQGRIPGQQVFLEEGDTVEFAGKTGKVYFVPGHTRGHIAYYFPPNENEEIGDLFCGDTIFAGGCGRLFEGTPAQMVESIGKLRNLPDHTRIWCAHEYTLNNLKFAVTVDKDNSDLQIRYQDVIKARKNEEATVPSLLGEEKKTNPFLRWDQPALQMITGMNDPARVFGKIRGMKDNF
ncbi:glyoxalase II [Crocosphaera subtropica ATCC 51142]|uniref:Hydroxyacylglutathione hydrolase n=1 Tax=Crocosphaera subtropica (strain ATCC 51142 / BH68) TaxID=43989 RepID=GLO2_CROS5|nr:hydroxyacylglutathione hydrolase [Crocosphaera subtropica]B1WUT9.1 RecName: Full=Hydroxyacylglutathione hydrolase; AltName: Full=Glyoxalase II; Short=Glx II [Crocosphaera subtropica ATCC 51142]ACB50540.1 glyoxalase II [Crocosphaera subtropica ATCC 51142]